METIPDKIYLQIEDNDKEPIPQELWTWCVDRINESDIEYVLHSDTK